MPTIRRMLLPLLVAAGILVPVVAASGQAAASVALTPLTLLNGWTNAPFGTNNAAVSNVAGIVTFRGAIATASTNLNPEPFVLAPKFRPDVDVYVPVDMCSATNGRLLIQPNGTVTVMAENSFTNAQCFTSLDGASFVKTTSVMPLALQNGWVNGPLGTGNAAATNHSGVVSLKGAIATTGSSAQPFVLPVTLRPATTTYVPVDMCNATNGRLMIQPSGVVTVMAENSFANAQCFTSLDGVSFVKSGATTSLTLLHAWTDSTFGTAPPAVIATSGIVHFQGGMSTSGSVAKPFTLPVGFRPGKTVYVQVDLCNATNGRLQIGSGGTVTVEAETSFANAKCLTSLDGASFVP